MAPFLVRRSTISRSSIPRRRTHIRPRSGENRHPTVAGFAQLVPEPRPKTRSPTSRRTIRVRVLHDRLEPNITGSTSAPKCAGSKYAPKGAGSRYARKSRSGSSQTISGDATVSKVANLIRPVSRRRGLVPGPTSSQGLDKDFYYLLAGFEPTNIRFYIRRLDPTRRTFTF